MNSGKTLINQDALEKDPVKRVSIKFKQTRNLAPKVHTSSNIRRASKTIIRHK